MKENGVDVTPGVQCLWAPGIQSGTLSHLLVPGSRTPERPGTCWRPNRKELMYLGPEDIEEFVQNQRVWGTAREIQREEVLVAIGECVKPGLIRLAPIFSWTKSHRGGNVGGVRRIKLSAQCQHVYCSELFLVSLKTSLAKSYLGRFRFEHTQRLMEKVRQVSEESPGILRR